MPMNLGNKREDKTWVNMHIVACLGHCPKEVSKGEGGNHSYGCKRSMNSPIVME
jgi:hypothetical protein